MFCQQLTAISIMYNVHVHVYTCMYNVGSCMQELIKMGGGGALEFPPPLSPSAPPPPPPPVGCISCLMQSVVCSSPNSFSLKMSCLGICVSLQESVLSYAQLYQESLRSLVSYAHYISMQCITPLPLVYVVACRSL